MRFRILTIQTTAVQATNTQRRPLSFFTAEDVSQTADESNQSTG
jgi:hypothetical protein